MAESFLLSLLLGAALGTLAGLGIGGGSLLMLWLTLMTHMDPAEARSINLLFFLPGALISTWLRRKRELAPKPVLLSAALSAAAGALLGSWLGTQVFDASLLRPVLGGLFVVTGIRELRYRERKFR